jgi:hypothetical protein
MMALQRLTDRRVTPEIQFDENVPASFSRETGAGYVEPEFAN